MASIAETATEQIGLAPFSNDLCFFLNGEEVRLAAVDPSVLLVDWLRSPAIGLTGTKKSCAQGGCGACTVMLSKWNPVRQRVEHRSINSCLRPVCSLDGMMITTTEGTGSCRTELSPVQYRIAKDNGSQCGFCTPGFVMNMTAFLVENEDRKDTIGQKEIEDIFDGNLCRCTGYRSILYGMKHFASDWSEKDEVGCLHTIVDPAERVRHAASVHVTFPDALKQPVRAVHYTGAGYDWYRPTTLAQVHAIIAKHPDHANVKLVGGNTSIGVYDRFVENPHILIDISQLTDLLGIDSDDAGLRVGSAVTYSDLLGLLDSVLPPADTGGEPPAPDTRPHGVLPPWVTPARQAGLVTLQYMARRTAGTIVRNAATLAGNTMLVTRHVDEGEPFPSDMFTALATLEASVDVSLASGESQTLPILDFANQYGGSDALKSGVLTRYHIPWTRDREYVRAFKTALREENAHSIVNAGFRVRFDEGGHVESAVIVLGGIGPVAFRATSAETFLVGRAWDKETVDGLVLRVTEAALANIVEHEQRMAGLPYEGFSNGYRTMLAQSFAYQFFVYVAEQRAPGSVPPEMKSAGWRVPRPVSKGTQAYEKYEDEYPVNLPIVKLGAFLQATGEACYTQDISASERTLEAAVVTSMSALATYTYRIPGNGKDAPSPTDVDGLIAYLKTRYLGFFDYITVRDIPAKGGNGPSDDPYFANGTVTSYGQCIGLVLARTEAIAIDIAHYIATACIDYDTGSGVPILNIAQAIEQKSIFPDEMPFPVHIWKVQRPGSDLSWTQAKEATLDGTHCQVVQGTQWSGAQLHFYMETQACVAIPGERDDMVVYSGSQSPDSIMSGVCHILGIPTTEVDVKINRVGGGYGGKTTRSPYVSSVVAVAAAKHHRTVRLAVRRENDSAMIGHRHPLLSNYALAIADGTTNPADKGRILGISTDFVSDGGASYDCSFVVMDCIQLRCDTSYMVPNYQTSGEVAKTNKTSNTAMRSMGLVQAILAQEDAIEQAAHLIGMLPEDVRGKNLYQQGQLTPFGQVVDYCYLDQVWAKMYQMADFEARRQKVEAFNAANRWRKRGISMIPVKYGSGYNATFLEQAGALVEVYSQDGHVLIRHGGVEIGQGLLTKVAQIAARELNLPLAYIETTGLDTQVVPNPVSTGASTGTSFNGSAVQEACRILRRRLEDYCLDLLKENGAAWCKDNGINFWDYQEGWRATAHSTSTAGSGAPPPPLWCHIISLANGARVNLSSQVRFVQQGGEAVDSGLIFHTGVTETVNHFTGFTFSAACTEVEVDVLTGEVTVIRADLLYDMGKSLNPAIDIGQVEGAYVQGLGYVLTEDVVWQPDGPNIGALNADNTWRYKVPATTTIPLQFNVDLFPRSDAPEVPENPFDLLSSKEVGEPPLVLAVTAFFAVKHAILAARRDAGNTDWPFLEAPATVQRVREACLVNFKDLTV